MNVENSSQRRLSSSFNRFTCCLNSYRRGFTIVSKYSDTSSRLTFITSSRRSSAPTADNTLSTSGCTSPSSIGDGARYASQNPLNRSNSSRCAAIHARSGPKSGSMCTGVCGSAFNFATASSSAFLTSATLACWRMYGMECMYAVSSRASCARVSSASRSAKKRSTPSVISLWFRIRASSVGGAFPFGSSCIRVSVQ
ncbi:hypothetical protein B0H16DRAFT_1508634 [Mycena metata]|uniref:Uncharacterized protein n=1 Tax=Mycena metata TaxID=1033252 RepID=A0AAD7JYV3_9AGAR|nr:hypothetical protein B0H16DRAFT_1508634 [Mycena metata]